MLAKLDSAVHVRLLVQIASSSYRKHFLFGLGHSFLVEGVYTIKVSDTCELADETRGSRGSDVIFYKLLPRKP